jgi:hypothetical protein
MKKITKYLGILLILPLFSGALATTYISEADAEVGPLLVLVDAKPLVGGQAHEYAATFRVYAGDSDILDVVLLVTSDAGSVENRVASGGKSDVTHLGMIPAGTDTLSTVKITAYDVDSIDGKILSFKKI